jgi:signal transduction histidine kinase
MVRSYLVTGHRAIASGSVDSSREPGEHACSARLDDGRPRTFRRGLEPAPPPHRNGASMNERVFGVASAYIERNAEALVATWIEWVKARVQTTTVTALPERALRNHVPPVLQSLARYLVNPIELAREELLGHLRLHGQIRRDQGYSLEEVLAEFDGLADLVTRGVNREVSRVAGDSDMDAVLELTKRLATGLRSISFITVGTYNAFDQERANAMSEGLEEFARAVAHELRNPINTLALGMHVLRERTADTDDLASHMTVMDAAIRRASSLIDTVHTLAVAEGARAGSRLALLKEALVRTLDDFAEEAKTAGVELRVEGTLPDVRVEAILLYIVLANVIGNAVKYHDPAKKKRQARISAKLIAEEHDSGFCEIRIADNGIGIPAEMLSRVFQKGFRAHPDHAQGTGLGLYMVQQAVTTRGGSIRLESDDRKGTTVTVRMRCLESESGALSADRFSVRRFVRESMAEANAEKPLLPDEQESAKG